MRYPEYIMRANRIIGLAIEENDLSRDDEAEAFTPEQSFAHWLKYEGFDIPSHKILKVLKDLDIIPIDLMNEPATLMSTFSMESNTVSVPLDILSVLLNCASIASSYGEFHQEHADIVAPLLRILTKDQLKYLMRENYEFLNNLDTNEGEWADAED